MSTQAIRHIARTKMHPSQRFLWQTTIACKRLWMNDAWGRLYLSRLGDQDSCGTRVSLLSVASTTCIRTNASGRLISPWIEIRKSNRSYSVQILTISAGSTFLWRIKWYQEMQTRQHVHQVTCIKLACNKWNINAKKWLTGWPTIGSLDWQCRTPLNDWYDKNVDRAEPGVLTISIHRITDED